MKVRNIAKREAPQQYLGNLLIHKEGISSICLFAFYALTIIISWPNLMFFSLLALLNCTIRHMAC